MLVGFMSDIPFVVSSSCIRTFDDYSRGNGGRWAQHDIIGEKPALEFWAGRRENQLYHAPACGSRH